MLARERAERLPRSDFEQRGLGFAQQRRDAIAEAHGMTDVLRPVPRIRRLVVGDPRARHVGDERDLGRAQLGRLHGLLERREGRLHHVGVEGVRGVQGPARDVIGLQAFLQCLHGRVRPAYDAHRRRVDDGHRHLAVQIGLDFLFGGADREHGPRLHGLHEPPALDDERERITQRHDAREARGHIFADAVPDHGRRLDALRLPPLRRRILDDEEGRLRVGGLPQLFVGRVNGVRLREEQGTQVQVEQRLQALRAAVDVLAEDGCLLVEIAAHVRVLCALTGEQECHIALGFTGLPLRHTTLRPLRQRFNRILAVPAYDGPPVLESAATHLQRVGDVGDLYVRVLVQVRGQILGRRLQRRFGARRDREQMHGPRAGLGLPLGRLFEDDVRVRAPHSERSNSCPSRRFVCFPRSQLIVNIEGRVFDLHLRIRLLEVEGRRNLPVL